MVAKIYIGLTIASHGGYTRITTHKREANRSNGQSRGLHYAFTRQSGVITNYYVVGTWTNHYVMDSCQETQDLERWLPIFLEGLLIIYLGTYHCDYKPQTESLQSTFSSPSYVLADQLRLELALPDLHALSLNRAWPLMQGVNGGMVKARQCVNPNCKRPNSNTLGDSLFPEFIST
ncbi:hypothetical protein FALBO_16868, partial [Fusarium albosuccineum]